MHPLPLGDLETLKIVIPFTSNYIVPKLKNHKRGPLWSTKHGNLSMLLLFRREPPNPELGKEII